MIIAFDSTWWADRPTETGWGGWAAAAAASWWFEKDPGGTSAAIDRRVNGVAAAVIHD
jgi:hypothetical protein